MDRSKNRRCGAIFLAGILACGLPDVTNEGLHVQVAADPGLMMCGGTLTHMDKFVSLVSIEFGLKPPREDARFRFNWLEDENFEGRTRCLTGRTACARRSTVFSETIPRNHELVHVIANAYGDSQAFFTEGLAVAYEGMGAGPPYSREILPDVWETLQASEYAEVDYLIAGAFTAFLIKRHGTKSYLRMYERLSRHADVKEIDSIFRDIFKESLMESVLDFEATHNGCFHEQYTAKIVECASPEIHWDGRLLIDHRTLDCEHEDAVGPYERDELVIFYTLRIDTAGIYEVRVIAERPDGVEGPPNTVWIQPCGGCESGRAHSVEAGEVKILDLSPGMYTVRIQGPSSFETEIGYSIERVGVVPRPDGDLAADNSRISGLHSIE